VVLDIRAPTATNDNDKSRLGAARRTKITTLSTYRPLDGSQISPGSDQAKATLNSSDPSSVGSNHISVCVGHRLTEDELPAKPEVLPPCPCTGAKSTPSSRRRSLTSARSAVFPRPLPFTSAQLQPQAACRPRGGAAGGTEGAFSARYLRTSANHSHARGRSQRTWHPTHARCGNDECSSKTPNRRS
jgi:hypothetical protein